ncbi:RNA/RNP complex-1-interacting phosphatase-like protein [Aphelenchoides besseyi]|nr:RNA/RNP complex-1-interacting phosphatase-like protein [Aphelenchoides besseyi]
MFENNDFDNAKALAVEVVEDPIPEPLVPAQKAEHVTSTFVSARKRLAKNEHFKLNAERSVLEEELAKKEMVLETKCPKFSIIVPTQPRSVSPPFIKRSLSPPQTPKAWVSRVSMVHLASSRHSRPSERSTNESELNDESVEGTNFNNSKTSTPPMFKAVSIERDIAIKYDDLSSAIHTQKVDNMINLFNKTLDECRRNKGRYWLLLEQPMSGVNTEAFRLLPEILFKCNFDRCQITHVVLNATDSLVTVFDTYEIKCSDILSTALPKCVKILMKKLPTTFNSLGILTVPVLPRFESSNKKMNETLMDILIKSRKEINYVRKVVEVKCFTMSSDDVAKPAELTYDVNSNRNEERGFRQRRRKYNRFDLPDRWSDYSAIGKVIPDARIIAFKTPLKSDFYETNNVDHFEVTDLLDKIKEFGGELGLVVDLTYTSKYYDPEQFTSHGILHKKIFCHGRDFEKLETSGTEFVEVLKDFFKENSNNNKWVGVHCTHGINRTGYLICRYLTESLEFEQARGHSIERIEYLETLRKFAALSTEDEAHKC